LEFHRQTSLVYVTILYTLRLYGGPAAEMRQCHLNNIHFYYYYYYYYT